MAYTRSNTNTMSYTFFKYEALKNIKYKYSLSNTNTISLNISYLESTLLNRMHTIVLYRNTVDLIIIERFYFLRGGQICEFNNHAIICIRNHGKTIDESTIVVLVSIKAQYLTGPSTTVRER